MVFIRLWFLVIMNLHAAFDELRHKPAPSWGFWAIMVRFVITSLTSILALHLLNPILHPLQTKKEILVRGYAAGVDLWITPQGQGYQQAPHLLGQHCVLPTYPQPPLLLYFLFLKGLKEKA